MRTEIERKFLVRAEALPPLPPGKRMTQGYLAFSPVVRVRLSEGRAWLTVKGEGLAERPEVEIALRPETAGEMLSLRPPRSQLIEKTRHEIEHGGKIWELDVFEGSLQGLMLAEIELDALDEAVELPPWVGEEVTGDSRYQNANLALGALAPEE